MPQQIPEDVIETVNSQNCYTHIIGFDTSFHSIMYPKKSPTWYLQLQKSTANTHFDVLFNLVWSHHWLKMPYFGHISCLLRYRIILLQNLQQETSGSKLGVLLPIMSMAVTWHWLSVGPSDMHLTRKASFKDTLFIGMHRGEPRPVLRDHISDCTFTRCKQTVFLY